MKFLKLIGFENLLILAFAQFIFKYGFLDKQAGLTLSLSESNYGLLVLASILIVAGGFLINNITATGSQAYGLSESTTYYIYGGLTIAGLVTGYYISNLIGRPSFMIAFAIGVGTLYFYSTNLRQSLLLGNILIGFLCGLSVIIIAIFAIYPVVGGSTTIGQLSTIFKIIADYAIFATVIGFILSLINDLKKTDTDYNAGLNTLPIAIGKARTAKVILAIGIVPVILILYYINEYLKELLWAMGYVLVFIIGPIVYFLFNILSAKTKKDFTVLEVVLKAVLVFSAISIAVITYNVQNNA